MSPSIVVIAEGNTEQAFKERLKRFLDEQRKGKPKIGLKIKSVDCSINEKEIKSRVPMYLKDKDCRGVVALTDVYPAYESAGAAKKALLSWMPKNSKCHAHAALYEFEAWLLVNWDAVLKMAGVKNKKPWGSNPETIDRNKPPSVRLTQLFAHEASPPREYKKVLHGRLLMDGLDLAEAAKKCSELKAFLNTLLKIAGYEQLK